MQKASVAGLVPADPNESRCTVVTVTANDVVGHVLQQILDNSGKKTPEEVSEFLFQDDIEVTNGAHVQPCT